MFIYRSTSGLDILEPDNSGVDKVKTGETESKKEEVVLKEVTMRQHGKNLTPDLILSPALTLSTALHF